MPKKIFDFLSSFGMMLAGVILLFVFSVNVLTPNKIYRLPKSGVRVCFGAESKSPGLLPISHPITPIAKSKNKFAEKLSAKGALVVDDRTDSTLFAFRPDVPHSLASITKLMSVMVILDQEMDWSRSAVISEDDDVGGSHAITVGERYTAEELWHLALVGSVNSAITTLVRLSGLDEDQFVQKMNEKARDLKLTTMHFTDPTGLDAGNVGNARDVARLLDIALAQEKIKNALQKSEYKIVRPEKKKNKLVWSTDWLLTKWIPSSYDIKNIVGKTGYITDSGYNFVGKLTKEDGRSVRVVVLGANSNEARFTEARDLADWVFINFQWPNSK